jgi:hypothetical protein
MYPRLNVLQRSGAIEPYDWRLRLRPLATTRPLLPPWHGFSSADESITALLDGTLNIEWDSMAPPCLWSFGFGELSAQKSHRCWLIRHSLLRKTRPDHGSAQLADGHAHHLPIISLPQDMRAACNVVFGPPPQWSCSPRLFIEQKMRLSLGVNFHPPCRGMGILRPRQSL